MAMTRAQARLLLALPILLGPLAAFLLMGGTGSVRGGALEGRLEGPAAGDGPGAGVAQAEAAPGREERMPQRERVVPHALAGRARGDGPEGPLLPAAEVTVLDVAGNPLEGALVEGGTEGGPKAGGRTGVSGRVLLELPAAAALDVLATAEGHLAAGVSGHPFGAPLQVRLAPAATLEGELAGEDGTRLGGFVVRVLGPLPSGRSALRTATDDRGGFLLRDLVPGTYDLRVEAPGGRWAGGPALAMVPGVVLPPGTSARRFAVPPGVAVVGTVKDQGSGRPLQDVDVSLRLEAAGAGWGGGPWRARARTCEEGAFRFPGVPPGSVRLHARTRGFAPAWARVEVRASRGEHNVDLALPAGVAVRGTVLDPQGKPAAGATVHGGAFQGQRLAGTQEARAAEDGSFVLTDLPPSRPLVAFALADGQTPVGAVVGNRAPGEVVEGVTLRFDAGAGAEVEGRVLSADGQAVEGASVALLPRPAPRFRLPARSGSDGTFRLDRVAALAYLVRVEAEGFLPAEREATVAPGAGRVRLEPFFLERALTLSGRVVWRPGPQGAGGARVRMVRADPVPSRTAPGRYWAVADAFGRFHREGLPAGRYRLEVSGAGIRRAAAPAQEVVVPAPSPLLVWVDPETAGAAGGIRGRLLEAAGGRPVEAFSVRGVPAGRVLVRDGGFQITGLPSGPRTLHFLAPGFQVLSAQVHVPAGGARELGDLWLRQGATLRVHVADARGRRPAGGGVRVRLTDRFQRTHRLRLRPASVQRGRSLYVFDGLAGSEFELLVRGPGGTRPFRAQVRLLEGETATVWARLEPAGGGEGESR